jgi:hypothetical protein
VSAFKSLNQSVQEERNKRSRYEEIEKVLEEERRGYGGGDDNG